MAMKSGHGPFLYADELMNGVQQLPSLSNHCLLAPKQIVCEMQSFLCPHAQQNALMPASHSPPSWQGEMQKACDSTLELPIQLPS